MKILFLLHSELDSNSGYHVDIYANRLAAMGHEVLVSYAGEPVDVGDLSYRAATHLDLFENTREHLRFVRPDVIHAWTPREIVRLVAEKVRVEVPDAKLVIHFEDNEELLAGAFMPEIIASRSNMRFFDTERGGRFVESADAFTFVVSTLEEIVPVGGRPFLTLGAPYEDRLFRPRARHDGWRREHGIPDSHQVVVYPGNLHLLNRSNLEALYRAVGLLADAFPVTLVRTGHFPVDGVAPANVLELGCLPRREMPRVLAAADLFIQPGKRGPFDNYRFPSKIPEMAITGRPIICPDLPCVAGFADREEVLKCELPDPSAIREAAEEVLTTPGLGARLSAGSVEAARRECDPAERTRALAEFLGELVALTA